MSIFLLFLIATLVELYVLISVGQAIGAFNTILAVVLTAAIGSFLLKQQGRGMLARTQQSLTQGKMPAKEILEGMILMISGILLLTPGFLTDVIGLLGLMPLTRQWFVQYIIITQGHRLMGKKIPTPTQHPNDPSILEGEFWEEKK